MTIIQIEATQDIDGVWRALAMKQGSAQTERFEGNLVGDTRPPAIADLAAYMDSQGYEVANRLPDAAASGQSHLVLFRPKPGLTPAQRIVADMQAVKAGAKPTEEMVSEDDEKARRDSFRRLRREA